MTSVQHQRVVPSALLTPVVASFVVSERAGDAPLIGLPRPEIDLVVRFGPAARGGIDAHARGASERVHRKVVRGVRRTVTARFRLGAASAVLGVPASAMTGRIAAIDELWGEAEAGRLIERLAGARSGIQAAAILDAAMCDRVRGAALREDRALAQQAAEQLRDPGARDANVGAIASALGVSERHLRRVFRDAFGMGPKAFARITRFERAVRDARGGLRSGWASVAAGAGYYDQAHLIAEFRAIAGVTPTALLGELGASIGIP